MFLIRAWTNKKAWQLTRPLLTIRHRSIRKKLPKIRRKITDKAKICRILETSFSVPSSYRIFKGPRRTCMWYLDHSNWITITTMTWKSFGQGTTGFYNQNWRKRTFVSGGISGGPSCPSGYILFFYGALAPRFFDTDGVKQFARSAKCKERKLPSKHTSFRQRSKCATARATRNLGR